MLHDPDTRRTLGADLRALRKARGLTLIGMAEALGRSVGWMSQVERDLSQPGIDDLRRMAALLEVPLSILFGQSDTPVAEAGYVVRASARRAIGSREGGLVEELLSPDLTDDFEVLHSTFAPGSALSQPTRRATQELGYVVSGQIDVTIAGTCHKLNAGDSFRIRGEDYSWANPYGAPAVVIWVIAPPVY